MMNPLDPRSMRFIPIYYRDVDANRQASTTTMDLLNSRSNEGDDLRRGKQLMMDLSPVDPSSMRFVPIYRALNGQNNAQEVSRETSDDSSSPVTPLSRQFDICCSINYLSLENSPDSGICTERDVDKPDVSSFSTMTENGLYCENQEGISRDNFTRSRRDLCLYEDKSITEMNQIKTCATSSFYTLSPKRSDCREFELLEDKKRRQPPRRKFANGTGTSTDDLLCRNASSETDGSWGDCGSPKSVNASNARFAFPRGNYRRDYHPPPFALRADMNNNGEALRDEVPKERQLVAKVSSWKHDTASTAASQITKHKSNLLNESGNLSRTRNFPECSFCKNNNEPKAFCQSHALKQWDSVTKEFILTCPVLRSYVCPKCHATGDSAHTFTHCPEVIKEQGHRPISIIEKFKNTFHDSSGRRRKPSISQRPF